MKHSHEAATTREPIEASGRSCEVEQRDELADELNLMADGRCLMAKVEACGDHRTAASLRQDLSAMAQRRADRAAARPKLDRGSGGSRSSTSSIPIYCTGPLTIHRDAEMPPGATRGEDDSDSVAPKRLLDDFSGNASAEAVRVHWTRPKAGDC